MSDWDIPEEDRLTDYDRWAQEGAEQERLYDRFKQRLERIKADLGGEEEPETNGAFDLLWAVNVLTRVLSEVDDPFTEVETDPDLDDSEKDYVRGYNAALAQVVQALTAEREPR